MVAYFQPFLVHLSHQKLSRRTIRKHLNNLWVLGGEIIRNLHETPALRKVPVERLVFDALREIDYQGYITIHQASAELGTEAAVKESARYLKGLGVGD